MRTKIYKQKISSSWASNTPLPKRTAVIKKPCERNWTRLVASNTCHLLCKTCFELETEPKKKRKKQGKAQSRWAEFTLKRIAELMYKCRIIARDKYKYDNAYGSLQTNTNNFWLIMTKQFKTEVVAALRRQWDSQSNVFKSPKHKNLNVPILWAKSLLGYV